MIVAVLAIVQVFGSSVFMIAGVMVPPLTDPEGGFRWGISELSMAFGLYIVFSAIFAPITGHLGDRFGARPMMFVGAVMYGVGMVALGFVSELWHIFLFYSFLMSFTASITMVPMMAAIQLDHDNANAYISPGTNYNALGQYELSIADNTKALQIGGNYDARSYYTRGLSYRALGQTSNANADKTTTCSLDSEFC